MCGSAGSFIEQEIGELETVIAQHRLAPAQRQVACEQRSAEAERVELPALAAGIDAGGQAVEQCAVVGTTAVVGGQLPGVHAAQQRAVALADEATRERGGVL